GVARAAFFPSISLTASGGAQSAALTDLFKGPAGVWSFFGSLTQPIFAGGRLSSGVNLAEAQQKEALVVYQQTIQQAFREVSDALVAYRRNREFREQQELLATSTRDALALSNQRYRGGAASYLEVLDSNTRTFAAELGLAQAQLNEPLAVQLAPRFTVIAIDLPGIGDSSIPANGIDMKTSAQRIHEGVHKLGYDRARVVGHDIGLMVTRLPMPVASIGGEKANGDALA